MGLDSTLNSVKTLTKLMQESLTTALAERKAVRTKRAKSAENTESNAIQVGSKHSATDITMSKKRIVVSGRNVTIKNGKVIVDGKVVHSNLDCYEVIVKDNVDLLHSDASVNVEGNAGKVVCRGSCNVDGNVDGDIDAGGSVNIDGRHTGKIVAGGSVCTGR